MATLLTLTDIPEDMWHEKLEWEGFTTSIYDLSVKGWELSCRKRWKVGVFRGLVGVGYYLYVTSKKNALIGRLTLKGDCFSDVRFGAERSFDFISSKKAHGVGLPNRYSCGVSQEDIPELFSLITSLQADCPKKRKPKLANLDDVETLLKRAA